jgi:hypothetical protein
MGTLGPLPALLAFALVAAIAQPQARHACLGTVVDADGKALVGAAVTLVWSPGIGAPGEPDVVQMTSDERGRFKADLVVGHAYSAWAIGPPTADGTRLVTEVTDRAAAGRVVELAASHCRTPRRVQCAGYQAWTEGGPLRLALMPDVRNGFTVPLAADADGAAELPPTPWITAGIALLDADGRIVQLQALAVDGAQVAFVGALERDVKVVDESGKPIAGATIEHDVPYMQSERDGDGILLPATDAHWHLCATTGADGTAHVRVPDNGLRWGSDWLRATTPTGTQVMANLRTRNDTKARERPDGPFVIRAARRDQAPGSVKGITTGELALAQLETEVSVEGSTQGLPMGLPVTIDATGHYRLVPLPPMACMPGLVLHLLPRTAGTPRCAFVAPAAAVPDRAPAAFQLPNIDLAALRTCRLSAVDSQNNPQPGAEVAVFATSNSPYAMLRVRALVLDHGGRADLLLDNSEWAVYATNGTAHALAFVDAGGDGPDLSLRLQPMPTLRLRVVDVAGKAVHDARATGAPGRGAFGGALTGARGWAKERIAMQIAWRAAAAARSDRDGLLVLPVQDWAQMDSRLFVRAGERRSESIALVASPDEQTVVVK